VNAKRASRTRSQEWLKEKPIALKRQLTSGVVLADARSDVHVLGLHESNTTRVARGQDIFVLDLPERPATGYRWSLEPTAREHFEVMRDEYVNVPAEDDRTSAEATRRFVLQAQTVKSPRCTRLVLSNTRRWDPQEPVQTFKLDVQLETVERTGLAFAEDYLVAA
jgi:predicted secreted protein